MSWWMNPLVLTKCGSLQVGIAGLSPGAVLTLVSCLVPLWPINPPALRPPWAFPSFTLGLCQHCGNSWAPSASTGSLLVFLLWQGPGLLARNWCQQHNSVTDIVPYMHVKLCKCNIYVSVHLRKVHQIKYGGRLKLNLIKEINFFNLFSLFSWN